MELECVGIGCGGDEGQAEVVPYPAEKINIPSVLKVYRGLM